MKRLFTLATALMVALTLMIGSAAADKIIRARTFFPFVDKYGQFMHDDWPGKIHSD
jgi:hypothetical protein